jgi:hypothetical protein
MLFLMLILWGLAEWGGWGKRGGRRIMREFREYLIIAGLVTALLPASIFIALVMSPRPGGDWPLGYWNDYPVGSLFGRWNLPLAILSVMLGIAGKGKGRWLLLVGAACLVLVWIMAVVHWPGNT